MATHLTHQSELKIIQDAVTTIASQLNPFIVVRGGEDALHAFLSKDSLRSKWSRAQTRLVFLACQSVATVCELSRLAGTVNEEFSPTSRMR